MSLDQIGGVVQVVGMKRMIDISKSSGITLAIGQPQQTGHDRVSIGQSILIAPISLMLTVVSAFDLSASNNHPPPQNDSAIVPNWRKTLTRAPC